AKVVGGGEEHRWLLNRRLRRWRLSRFVLMKMMKVVVFAVCKHGMVIGETVKKLPCGHCYHAERVGRLANKV
ncbi:unnamed protein product, partial [Brassica rapa subsp. trilocularis]